MKPDQVHSIANDRTVASPVSDQSARAVVGGAPTEQDAESFVRMLLWDTFPECCGCPVEDYGGEYMGQREVVMSCCGNPEPALLNDAQIVASLRERFQPQGEASPQDRACDAEAARSADSFQRAK